MALRVKFEKPMFFSALEQDCRGLCAPLLTFLHCHVKISVLNEIIHLIRMVQFKRKK